jgi:hypothetical protein
VAPGVAVSTGAGAAFSGEVRRVKKSAAAIAMIAAAQIPIFV